MSTNAAYRFERDAFERRSQGYAAGVAADAAYVYGSAAPKRAPQPTRRIDVVSGGARGRAVEESPSHAFAIKVAKATVALVAVFAIIGFGRVTLNAATVAEALEGRQVSTQLEDARSAISELEVQQSSLSNPTRIKAEAAALGMVSPETTHVIDLSDDVVVTDEGGNLLLSESIESVAAIASDGSGEAE